MFLKFLGKRYKTQFDTVYTSQLSQEIYTDFFTLSVLKYVLRFNYVIATNHSYFLHYNVIPDKVHSLSSYILQDNKCCGCGWVLAFSKVL